MLLTAAFTACNNEEIITGSENGTPLKLNVQTAEINTRAVIETTTLPDASQIGVTLVDDSGTTYDGITYNNLLYTTSGTECTTENTPMLSATTGTLYGYYPYNSDVTDMTQIPVTAGDTDYMYATPVQNLSDGKPTANMQMNHALAVIRLNIVRGTYTGTGAVTSVAVKGDNIATAGTLDAKTGALSSQTGAGEAITNTTAFTLSAQAKQIDNIIVPVTSSSGDVQGNATPRAAVNATPTFTMTIDGSEYIATADAVSLEQGYIYTYTLTVNGKDVSLSDVQVGDWGYNDSGNPVINAGYKITLAGDLTGIAINNTVNDDGSVTITAVPNYVLPVAKAIAKAECSAGATCTQSLNELGGQTILLSNITQDITLTFNGIGDKNGVYAVTATGELIAYDDASVDATCLGVVLITDNQKIMIEKNETNNTTSIKAAYTEDGATNAGYQYFYWGPYGSDVSGITNWTGGAAQIIPTDYTTWSTNSTYAWNDFNGKANTAALLNVTDSDSYTTYANAATYCKIFNETATENQGYSDWYIPSAGQLSLICINLTEINAALTKIGGTTFSTSGYYWSSSEYTSGSGWVGEFYFGTVGDCLKYNHNRVRFVRDYNEKDFGTIDLKTADNGVYAVAKNGKGMPVEDADESCTAVALIVNDAPTPQRIMIEKNGEANITSIKAAYEADGASDTGYTNIYWGPYGTDVSDITNWTAGLGISISTDYNTWKNNSTRVWNDYNGKANTAALMNVADSDSHTKYANAATYCVKFNETKTENQGFSDWYIPACGQLALIYINVTDINAALTKIGGTTIRTSTIYWSSSEYNSNHGWYVGFYNGKSDCINKSNGYLVRFVRDIE